MIATPSLTSFVSYPGSALKPSLLDVTIKSTSILNPQGSVGTLYDAWCLDERVQLAVPATYTTLIYSTYELATLASVPTLSANRMLANLDNINWLLNHYDGTNAAYGDVQGAIWKMMGISPLVVYVGPQSIANIDALIALAMQHDGFVPEAGQTIGVIMDTMQGTTHRQPLIVEMKAAALGDYVWHDTNANGVQDAGESGIAGAVVRLVRDQNLDGDFSDANEVLATTTTNAAGAYSFKGLTPGLNYQVQFSLPSGYDAVSPRQADANGTSGFNSDALLSNLIVLAPGENLTTIDAGFYKQASLGDRLWLDANGNGQQDAGEAGIAGATVTLLGGGADGLLSTTLDNTSTTTVTGADGIYAFNGLMPGREYQVQFSKAAGTVFTGKDKGDDASDSDVNADGLSQVVKLSSGENNRTIDAGVFVPASLGDRLWLDANGNGQQDAGEAGIAGATVTLLGGGADGLLSTTADNTSTTTVTGADGAYAFTGLTPGAQYQVQFTKPAGSVFTGQDKGNDDSDSDVNASGLSQVVTLTSGENNRTIDAGVFLPASLGDRLWLDANGNGQQDAGEAGVAGARVTLIGGGADGLVATTGDNTSVTTITGADGAYGFAGLTPGVQYQVQFSAPADAVFTGQDKGADASDSDANSAGLSQVVTLVSGENNSTIDAGVYVPASLGDRVWVDTNANGQQDDGATGIAGLAVTLIGGGADGLLSTTADNTSASTTTGIDGDYAFTGLTPGMEYQVQFSKPADTVFTGQDSGNDASDSDAGATGLSQVVKLVSGENNRTIDAGVYAMASLGDRLWLDANGNGQQDAGEAGIVGATITLLGGGADGLLSTTLDNTSTSTVTGADGIYAFNGLMPGREYQVQFSKAAGTVFTGKDKGDDASDSDVNADGLSQVVKLSSGENNRTIDAGVFVPASLGDRLWLDANGNGQQDAGEAGIAGATVTLLGGGADGLLSTTADNTSTTTVTGADGAYAFTGLTPGAEYQVQFTQPAGSVFTGQDKGNDDSDSDVNASGLSQVVTLTSGENNRTIDAGVFMPASLGDRLWLDANGNGQQDAGEAGVAGATVTLIGGGADGLVATTGDNTSVTTVTGADGAYGFNGLTPGMQYQVQFSAPAGAVFTGQDKGADASDSDANSNGLSQVVTLVSGENNSTIDAGVYVPASLGDRVWVDTNANGQQDDGATGIAGLAVTLIGGGADGLLSTTADNTSASTTTGIDGDYAFTGLTPGMEYQVQFSKPADTVFTGQDSGNDASDSDAGATGLSQVVKLVSGENNRTIDAGVYAMASLGDRLWLDANGNGQQDAGEAGIAGATVTLLGGGADGLLSTTLDNTSTTTVTGADGIYAFNGLMPGREYQVQFSKAAGTVFSGKDKGDDATDSDVNADGLSQVIKLSSGENNRTIDAGVFAPASLGDRLWLDANGNGQQDAGESGIAGATVTLLGGGADGLLSTTADNTSSTTVTGADGAYAFTGLTPGAQYQVQFTKPAGSVFTGQDKGSDASDSDVNAAGLSQIVTLTSGENNRTIDAGVFMPASLGDRLWLDANGNGQQDAGEAGVAGATVTLIGGGTDGLVATTGDNISVTTITGANGAYGFTGLTPGMQYQVQFSAPGGAVFTGQDKGADTSDSDANSAGLSQVVTLVSGENNSTIDAGVYVPASLGDRVWVDTNANGQQDDGATGISGLTVTLIGGGTDGLVATTSDNTSATTITGVDGEYAFNGLTPGMEYQVQFSKPAGTVFTSKDRGLDASDSDAGASGLSQVVKLASGENNRSIDAGVYTPASLGDRVWIDANGNGQQDAGEAGVVGATVTLIGGGADGLVSTTADNTTATTVTGTNGFYQFGSLTPGMQYQVQFAMPAGMQFTKQNTGADGSDSDADIVTGKSQIVTLASGENNTTIDAGVYALASAGDRLWIDTNANGQQDDGATGLAGRTVTLLGGGADGVLSTTGDNTSTSMVTGTDGVYNFSNLTPGVQYQVQFSKPTGYVYSAANLGNDVSDSDANAGTGLTQMVILQSGESNKTLDAGLTNVSGDLSITKTDGLTSVKPGQSITYTIVVKNTGTALATDALVTDALPSTLTNITWTSSATAGASGNITSGTGAINDYVTIAGGASITYTVKATVASLSALESVADFGSMTNNTRLAQNITVNDVRADAFYLSNGFQTTSTTLWARNATGDHGVGSSRVDLQACKLEYSIVSPK